MPAIVFAGLDRADFQRLQTALMNSGVRMRNLDLSKPNNLAIPDHDRLIICPKTPDTLKAALRGRTKKYVDFTSTVDKLGPLVLDEIKKVREEKK